MDKLKWVIGALIAVAVLLVGGTWVYINVVRDEAPERLAFDAGEESQNDPSDEDATPDPTVPGDGGDETPDSESDGPDLEGRWEVGDGSVVGYRVAEVLFGQSTEGYGRTESVEGHLVIEGTTITEASFTADMATVESDDDRRDRQFRGRIMDVDSHPSADLVLVESIALDRVPDEGEIIEVTAMVDLTLRGTTRTIPFDLRARHTGSRIEIDGSVVVVFEEWGIPNPSTVGITTEDEGELEVLLLFDRA